LDCRAPGDDDKILEGVDDSTDPSEPHELSEAKPELEPCERGDDDCPLDDANNGGGETGSAAVGCVAEVLMIVFGDASKGLLLPPALAGRLLLSPNRRDMVGVDGALLARNEAGGWCVNVQVGAKVTLGVAIVLEGPAYERLRRSRAVQAGSRSRDPCLIADGSD